MSGFRLGDMSLDAMGASMSKLMGTNPPKKPPVLTSTGDTKPARGSPGTAAGTDSHTSNDSSRDMPMPPVEAPSREAAARDLRTSGSTQMLWLQKLEQRKAATSKAALDDDGMTVSSKVWSPPRSPARSPPRMRGGENGMRKSNSAGKIPSRSRIDPSPMMPTQPASAACRRGSAPPQSLSMTDDDPSTMMPSQAASAAAARRGSAPATSFSSMHDVGLKEVDFDLSVGEVPLSQMTMDDVERVTLSRKAASTQRAEQFVSAQHGGQKMLEMGIDEQADTPTRMRWHRAVQMFLQEEESRANQAQYSELNDHPSPEQSHQPAPRNSRNGMGSFRRRRAPSTDKPTLPQLKASVSSSFTSHKSAAEAADGDEPRSPPKPLPPSLEKKLGRISADRWSRLEYRLGLASASTHVSDGVAGEHAFAARVEAARKLVGNHRMVLIDLTRPGGGPKSQPELKRLPGKEMEVDMALYEVARRLVGRKLGERVSRVRPRSLEQGKAWQGAMAYLDARLQSTSEEVAAVPGHEHRKPDMGVAAAAAMRAVMAEVALECESGEFGDDTDHAFGCSGEEFSHLVAWTTMVLFAIGALILLILFGTLDNNHKEPIAGTFAVCSIAACAYLAKNTGMGEIVVYGTAVPIARYLDWILTTPLMLYELCHIGGADTATTTVVIVSDILMLATGIFAACLSRVDHTRLMLVWFAIGCLFYVVMVAVLHVKVATGTVHDEDEKTQTLFYHLERLTLTTWSFYPVVVFLGRAQLKMISKPTEDTLLCVLDCLAKLGMEGLIVFWAVFVWDDDGSSSADAH